jgi:DNA polymerase epsilon subunit 2
LARLDAAAAACADDMWVIMADVFLDRPDVLANLGRVLSVFEAAEAPPTLFVLMGDFCSTPFGPAASSLAVTRGARLCAHAARAARLLLSCPHVRH